MLPLRQSAEGQTLVESRQGPRRHIVDQLEQVVALAVDGVGPDAVTGPQIRQLQIHAHQVAGREKVALQHAVDLELLTGGLRVDLLVAELEHRRSRAHLQRRNRLQFRDERVGEADREKVVARAVRDVVERQHGQRADRRLRIGGLRRRNHRCVAAADEVDSGHHAGQRDHGNRHPQPGAASYRRRKHRTAVLTGRSHAGRVDRLEVVNEIVCVVIATGRIFLEKPADDLRRGRRKRRIERNERLRLRAADLFQHEKRAIRIERQMAGRHLIEHDADREEIAALVRLSAVRLFGREKMQRSEELAARRCERWLLLRRADLTRQKLRETEVENLHEPGRLDDDVGGLEVAMDDAGRVRGGDARGDLPGDAEELARIELTAPQPLRERLSLAVLHHDERLATGRLADLVDGGDVLVADPCGGARLPQKPAATFFRQDVVGIENLDRHLASESLIPGQVNGAHPAFAEDPGDLETINRVWDFRHDLGGPTARILHEREYLTRSGERRRDGQNVDPVATGWVLFAPYYKTVSTNEQRCPVRREARASAALSAPVRAQRNVVDVCVPGLRRVRQARTGDQDSAARDDGRAAARAVQARVRCRRRGHG